MRCGAGWHGPAADRISQSGPFAEEFFEGISFISRCSPRARARLTANTRPVIG